MSFVDIVFDGPPSHESGRFVEVEDATGASIKLGEWIDRANGLWALRIPQPDETQMQNLQANIEVLVDEKHDLLVKNAELTAVNERLGLAAKALVEEKGALQKELHLLTGAPAAR